MSIRRVLTLYVADKFISPRTAKTSPPIKGKQIPWGLPGLHVHNALRTAYVHAAMRGYASGKTTSPLPVRHPAEPTTVWLTNVVEL
jgi:hypothetical protein